MIGLKQFLHREIESVVISKNLFDGLSDATGLIVLCELNKNEEGEVIPRQNLYGIEFSQKIRRKGFRGVIVFTSFLSRKQVFANKLSRSIINTVGHSFVQLPCTPQDLKKEIEKVQKQLKDPLNPQDDGFLSHLQLYDIKNNYCEKSGIAQQELHVLDGLATRSSLSLEEINAKCKKSLQKVCELFDQSATSCITEYEIQFPKLTKENKSAAFRFVKNYCNDLIERFSSNKTGSKLNATYPWKLLLLDDEIEQNHPFVTELQNRNIEVIVKHTVDDALLAWDEDHNYHPRIMVGLSDYRLEEVKDGVRVHQSKQGYQFLSTVSRSNRVIKIAVLSALPRKFLFESFKHYGIRTQIYSKKDFPLDKEQAINFLCDEMVTLGEENWSAIQSLPETPGWHAMENSYVRYRAHPNYENLERKLSHKLKVNADVFEKSESLPDKFETPSNPYSPKKLKGNIDLKKDIVHFLNHFESRRIAIWLGAARNKTLTLDNIISQMAHKRMSESMRKKIFNALGLVLTDYPFGITVEEQNWLQNEMNIPVFKEVSEFRQVLRSILAKIQDSFMKHSFLKAYLEDQNFIECIYNKQDIKVYFDLEFYPLIRSTYGIKALVSKINEDIDKGDEGHKHKLKVLLDIKHAIIESIKKYRDISAFKSLQSFLNDLKNVENEKRDHEYRRLYEPWKFIRAIENTPADVKTLVLELIEVVREDNRDYKPHRGIASRLHTQVWMLKNDVPMSGDEDKINSFIFNLASEFNKSRQKEYELDYKISNVVPDESEKFHTTTSNKIGITEIDVVLEFAPTIKFMEDKEIETFSFTEDEKDEIQDYFTILMKDKMIKADQDEDAVLFFKPHHFSTFLEKTTGDGLCNTHLNARAIFACNGKRIINDLEDKCKNDSELAHIQKGIWALK